MSRRRRALLLLGLALVLGGLAASDVARREAALDDRLGPLVPVVVAARDLAAGRDLAARDLAVRRVPSRFAPAGAARSPLELLGRPLAFAVSRGGDLSVAQLEVPETTAGPAVAPGQRAAEVVAAGSPELVAPGARVDVLVTRERGDGGAGATELALEDVEVLAARAAPAAGRGDEGPRVAATLRVTVRQAVYLAAAQAFARDVRLLARAPGDRRRTGGVSVGDTL